jgi:hypothetical protein
MAGAYQSIPLGRDYTFTTNVATRLTALSANMSGATLYFMAKQYPDWDTDSQAAITLTPTANTTTNIVTVTIPRVNTSFGNVIPLMFWEVSMLTANNLFYTLDSGRMGITEPVKLSA